MHTGIVSIPLEEEITMTVGYLMHSQRNASPLLVAYLEQLREVIRQNPTVSSQE